MSAAVLLDRLDGVRETGPGRWLARCPAHPDRTPSLSIRELADGRVLLHDFGGCDTADVLATLGLAMADLFDKPLGAFTGSRFAVPAADLLNILAEETTVVAIIAADLLARRTIVEGDWLRFARAATRIQYIGSFRHG